MTNEQNPSQVKDDKQRLMDSLQGKIGLYYVGAMAIAALAIFCAFRSGKPR